MFRRGFEECSSRCSIHSRSTNFASTGARPFGPLPVEIGLLAAVCVVLFVVSAFVAVPIWIAATLVGLSAFTVFGDMANIAYISWRLRGIEPPQA
jgi:hypothetical protein